MNNMVNNKDSQIVWPKDYMCWKMQITQHLFLEYVIAIWKYTLSKDNLNTCKTVPEIGYKAAKTSGQFCLCPSHILPCSINKNFGTLKTYRDEQSNISSCLTF